MLRRFGVNVTVDQVRVKNVAAVMVTAELPPFAKKGSTIDVTVNSIGDAKSLQGGQLLQTPLLGADGKIYAAAQGAISIGGFNFEAGGSKVQKNHVNVGRIPRGANIENEAPATLTDGGTIQITLREPDFTTANRAAAAIRRQMPGVGAQALDAATITIAVPSAKADDLISFIAQVEAVRVTPDAQAKIVVNERTGTVVMGGNVRLAPGSIAHGAINIKSSTRRLSCRRRPLHQCAAARRGSAQGRAGDGKDRAVRAHRRDDHHHAAGGRAQQPGRHAPRPDLHFAGHACGGHGHGRNRGAVMTVQDQDRLTSQARTADGPTE